MPGYMHRYRIDPRDYQAEARARAKRTWDKLKTQQEAKWAPTTR